MSITKPVFIFGCNNSGTTILWQALKRHNHLSGPDIEDQDITDMPSLMTHYLGNTTFRLWAHPKFKLSYYLTENDYDDSDAECTRAVYARYINPTTRLIAKSPAHTLRARLIQSYFPDAFFVAIVRNGYAVAEGIIRKRKVDPERPQFRGLFTTIEEAAEHWFRANVIILSHQQFLTNFMVVRYEDLVEDPGSVLNRILGFCQLPPENFPVPSFHKNLNREQIDRLSEFETETVTRICAPMLIHFGYQVLQRPLKW